MAIGHLDTGWVRTTEATHSAGKKNMRRQRERSEDSGQKRCLKLTGRTQCSTVYQQSAERHLTMHDLLNLGLTLVSADDSYDQEDETTVGRWSPWLENATWCNNLKVLLHADGRVIEKSWVKGRIWWCNGVFFAFFSSWPCNKALIISRWIQ